PLLSRRVEAAELALDAAERALASAADAVDEPFEPSVGRGASQLANVTAAIAVDRTFLAVLHGEAERATMFASRTLAEVEEGEWLLASHAGGYLGVAELLPGRRGEAVTALAANIARSRVVSELLLAACCSHP